MMVWNDTFCLRLLWPFRFIAARRSPAARRRCASTPRALDQTMVHRIEMNVVQMRREIPVVTDRMFPVPRCQMPRSPRRIIVVCVKFSNIGHGTGAN
jgi:hypothetical protein